MQNVKLTCYWMLVPTYIHNSQYSCVSYCIVVHGGTIKSSGGVSSAYLCIPYSETLV